MPGVARMGDNISGDVGAGPTPIVSNCIPNVLVNGMPIAVLGSIGAVHAAPPPHPPNSPVVAKGSATVLAGGKPVARIGDPCVCIGAPTIIAGSGNVIAG